MNHKIIDYIRRCEEQIAPMARRIQEIALVNQERVLEAYWTHRVAQTDLLGSTGYGLSDVGREKFEAAFADVFGAQAALVRPQIVSGTHALTLGFFGVLRPGKKSCSPPGHLMTPCTAWSVCARKRVASRSGA
ncbi:hypothetical protein GCM10025859_18690 [Alicyclobacillus fastidiosus]|nr:hypothetical protein GCM10025859_18690 [Alicyclobacillus fastidiosus]